MASHSVNERAVERARRLIACQYRAAEWRHKDIELAAHDLLQLLDERSGLVPSGTRRAA